MICPKCREAGQRSKVYPGQTLSTLMARMPRTEAQIGRWYVWFAFAGQKRRLVLCATPSRRSFTERYGMSSGALGPITLGCRWQARCDGMWWDVNGAARSSPKQRKWDGRVDRLGKIAMRYKVCSTSAERDRVKKEFQDAMESFHRMLEDAYSLGPAQAKSEGRG